MTAGEQLAICHTACCEGACLSDRWVVTALTVAEDEEFTDTQCMATVL